MSSSNDKVKSTGDDSSRPSKKPKVSDDEAEKVPLVVEEVAEQWDGIRVLSKDDAIQCRSCQDSIATATWASNLTGDTWDLCDPCQMQDFGECYKGAVEPSVAEPPTSEEVPLKALEVSKDASSLVTQEPFPEKDFKSPPKDPSPEKGAENMTETRMQVHSASVEAPSPQKKMEQEKSVHSSSPPTYSPVLKTPPAISQTQDDKTASVQEDLEDEDGDEGQYDLKKILTLEELQQEDSICCSQDACGGLPAFGLYVNSADLRDRWYYCLDCQEDDFDGWPPIEELPVKHLTPEHLRAIAKKCSRQKNPPMPVFPHSPRPNSEIIMPTNNNNNNDHNTTVANFVTPPPPDFSLVQSKSIGPATKPTTQKQKAIQVHKKWLEAAQAMGDKDARIVVSKQAAKKLIFDFLYDAFQPMNITMIYKGLRAVVPQPVLSACLQEMIPDKFSGKAIFHDSDDEEDDAPTDTKENSEPYSASLVFKAGKSLNTNLYFCDYSKIKGMDHNERSTLLNDLANSKAEKASIEASLKANRELAAKLLREPTNEELNLKLQADEKIIEELDKEVAEAQKLKVNEKHKKDTKKKIEKMASAWRSRRRMCNEFLTNFEELTDGGISRASCLKGDGPIELDSDDAIANSALEMAKKKASQRKRSGSLVSQGGRSQGGLVRKMPSNLKSKSNVDGIESKVVAVNLDAQLNIVRIYADDQ